MSSKRWCMHSMQAHQRLVLLVDLLAMGPLNPDESVRHDGGAFAVKQASHAALLREYGQPASISCLASLASSPESSAVAAGGGHLFLLACGCLVAQRCHARRLDPELSLRPSAIHALLSPKGHSRYPHGISTPTACLPASQPFALPTATTASGMPCPATACEPRSICVSYLAHPVLPLYLYASVPNRCQ